MARYVNAELAPIYLNTFACEQIKSMPTEDVRPERYGEWVYGENDIPHCSECGAEVKEISPFCPKCGAKMDEKDGDSTMIVEWVLETGYAGCEHSGEIEMPNDATTEEIEEAVKDEAYNYIDLGWRIKEDGDSNDV